MILNFNQLQNDNEMTKEAQKAAKELLNERKNIT